MVICSERFPVSKLSHSESKEKVSVLTSNEIFFWENLKFIIFDEDEGIPIKYKIISDNFVSGWWTKQLKYGMARYQCHTHIYTYIVHTHTHTHTLIGQYSVFRWFSILLPLNGATNCTEKNNQNWTV